MMEPVLGNSNGPPVAIPAIRVLLADWQLQPGQRRLRVYSTFQDSFAPPIPSR